MVPPLGVTSYSYGYSYGLFPWLVIMGGATPLGVTSYFYGYSYGYSYNIPIASPNGWRPSLRSTSYSYRYSSGVAPPPWELTAIPMATPISIHIAIPMAISTASPPGWSVPPGSYHKFLWLFLSYRYTYGYSYG